MDIYEDKLIAGLVSKGFEVKYYKDTHGLYAKRRSYEISLSLGSRSVVVHKLNYQCGKHYIKYDWDEYELSMNLYTPLGDFSIFWHNDDLFGEVSYKDLMLLTEKPIEFAIQFVGEQLPLSASFLAELRTWNDDKTAEINEC